MNQQAGQMIATTLPALKDIPPVHRLEGGYWNTLKKTHMAYVRAGKLPSSLPIQYAYHCYLNMAAALEGTCMKMPTFAAFVLGHGPEAK